MRKQGMHFHIIAEATSQPWSFLHNGAPKAGKALMTYRNAHKKGHLAETIVLCCG